MESLVTMNFLKPPDFLIFQIMFPRRYDSHRNLVGTSFPAGANIEEVHPTHGMQTRYWDYAPDFTAPPGFPQVPTTPLQAF